ncbi:MAG: acyl-ACP--UDP-N-acetylglucosamine O-acyltransferase [Prevotella sp.]|nr:acyl-ACP--UDP-N-acetylglucosamine O-acyltransferase [Bacteroides sp.]MCM1365885.1 acyl-ACP--UDP-N-acetylglucosamine O-acyltransferase [Prevotella sp.]
MTNISPLAFVNPGAILGDNVTIDAFAFIDEGVIIGDNCHIRPHVSILRGSRIGKNNKIYEGAIIGAEPQDFRWKGEKSFVEIGDNNKIREHVIINRSIREGQSTVIGNNSFIMAQSHIGHDSQISDWCVLGNAVKIAGDCKVGNYSILSSNALVHERCEIGEWCLIKGGCRVNGHVPPYAIMAHNPIEYSGVNAYVLRRGKFSEDAIENIAKCYRQIYESMTSLYNAVKRINIDVDVCPERDAIINFIVNHNYKLAAAPKID